MTRYSVAVMGWTLWNGVGKIPHGAAVVTYELTKRLSKFFDCEMIFETSDQRKARHIVDTDKGFIIRYVLRPQGLWRLNKEFLQRYDVIHIWDRAPVFTYRAHTKIIVPHCHTHHSIRSMINWIRLAAAFFIPNYDAITVASSSLARALTQYWETPGKVIPYGVDLDTFRPMNKIECRERLNIPKDCFILGYLGRPDKIDFTVAYKTMKRIKEETRRDDIVLLVAGGRTEMKLVYVKDDFLYLGYLDPATVPLMLNSCDVFFNPITSVREGFGLSIIEAMACGLPIITTAWNGYTDSVIGDVGFLARTLWRQGDVWINQNDLVDTCIQVIKDDGLREHMSKEARKRAECEYNWDDCVDQYRQTFIGLIQRTPPPILPYQDAPEKVYIPIKGKQLVFTLEEAMKNPNKLKIVFQRLYDEMVSDKMMKGAGWVRHRCIENVINLPKYRGHVKDTLLKEENRVRRHFPKLVQAWKNGYKARAPIAY